MINGYWVNWFYFWCANLAEDAVFMENDAHRNEYVMEDFGYIWKGVSGQEEKSPWTFGQVKPSTS